MNKKIKFILLISILSLPFLAQAQGTTYTEMAVKVKTALLTVAASIVVIGWVIAGILYLVSIGDPGKIGTAKKALVAAVIGTIVILLASGAAEVISSLLGLDNIAGQ